MKKPNGYIMYNGPSEIDGKPIVVIATGFNTRSANPKTGDMIQTYILRSDMTPSVAVKTREDSSICGDCKHRGFFGSNRTCYVNIGQAPTAIYNAFKRGSYPEITLGDWETLTTDRSIRLGSYGDPAAIPQIQLDRAILHTKNHTGYTHFWKTEDRLKAICMASVDSEAEYKEAKKAGWRTFRVKTEGSNIGENEVECPAIAKPGIIQCQTCKLCNGLSNAKDVTLNVHGAKWKIDNFKTLGQ